ncbi:TetR/AcrR family transcriptional regulator [Oceanihabitans sp.]|nr:TetR/AcrR family transcriptional regulator [Oceanihabitans sp.]
MTKKQDNIIKAALDLFSKDGFHATSTNKIATKAEVSEGLIFRHFKNKEGLIYAILKLNETQINSSFTHILEEDDAKQVIKKTLEFPFNIDEIELDYWRLQYKLKWELQLDNYKILKPLEDRLVKAFTKLKYKKPVLESNLVLHILRNLIASIIVGEIENKNLMKDFLIQKYYL